MMLSASTDGQHPETLIIRVEKKVFSTKQWVLRLVHICWFDVIMVFEYIHASATALISPR